MHGLASTIHDHTCAFLGGKWKGNFITRCDCKKENKNCRFLSVYQTAAVGDNNIFLR